MSGKWHLLVKTLTEVKLGQELVADFGAKYSTNGGLTEVPQLTSMAT